MVDRESARKSGRSDNSADAYEAPIGISKKTVVYLAIMVLIAVCFSSLTNIVKNSSAFSNFAVCTNFCSNHYFLAVATCSSFDQLSDVG